MNTFTSSFPVAFDSVKPRRSNKANLYASEAQTRALLRRGSEYRFHRINASDMITTGEAVLLSGISRVTINAWLKSGRCIGVKSLRSSTKIPKWQFEPYVFPVLQAVSEALATTDGWQMLSFLETPHVALGGLTPRIALEQGVTRQRIVELAAAHGH